MRQRYSVVVSAVYVLLGAVIIARGLAAHSLIPGILGIVFVALGAVRLCDFITWRRKSS